MSVHAEQRRSNLFTQTVFTQRFKRSNNSLNVTISKNVVLCCTVLTVRDLHAQVPCRLEVLLVASRI